MVDWARWRHNYHTTALTNGRHFLLGPGAEDCAPTPLSQGRIKVVKSTGKMFIISNRSFILKTGNGQCSRFRRLNNGVPQGSTVLFNIYITDISETVSTQNGYADDLALLFSHKCWHEVEKVLSLDMQRIADYLPAWRLRLSTAKITSTAFHLNNKESSRKHPVTVNGATIPYTQNPTYLGVMLDRQLTLQQHLKGLCSKVRACDCLLRLLAGSTWRDHSCYANFNVDLCLHCRGIRSPSLVPQHPH